LASIYFKHKLSFQGDEGEFWVKGKFQIINKRLKYFRDKEEEAMTTDKEKLGQLVERIDEILSVLNQIAGDLKTVSSSIKSLAVGQITNQPSPKASAPAPKETGKQSSSLEDIRVMFPENLDSMLSFEEKDEYLVIKPKQFLGSENFAKIASTVRGIGGEYISAGRDSHFRVYKKK
jgi:hypothetical protein